MKWMRKSSEMCQLMIHIRRYIIQIERQPGSRRAVGRITSCPGIILEPRIPPREGQSKEKSQERATRAQGGCRLRRPGEELRGEPRQWRNTPVEEPSYWCFPETPQRLEFGSYSETSGESQASPKGRRTSGRDNERNNDRDLTNFEVGAILLQQSCWNGTLKYGLKS